VATLPPLGDDLHGYLECRTRACGRELASIVELAAVPAIAEKLTAKVGQQRIPMSYPLAVNNVVTRAMNLAAEIGAPLVTSDVVRAT
jgi:type II secretory pathway predicted ATPase ExeA